jgi:crossover junction endodeoxyribonuclease RuvC
VKLAITGYGAADKKQMQKMIARLLSLDEVPKPADAADALGLAITHVHAGKLRRMAAGA